MITTKELQEAVISLLREKAKFDADGYDILFERNEVPSPEEPVEGYLAETGEEFGDEPDAGHPKPYFYVAFSERRKTVDSVYCDRNIAVSIEFHPQPDSLDDIDDEALWNIEDTLGSTLYPVFDIRDRHLTVIDISHRIFDGTLHFRFELNFRDSRIVTRKEDGAPIYEMMEHLDAKLTAEGREHAFEAEKEE